MTEEEIKLNLSRAYKILAHLGMDDHTYTHLSSRSGDGKSYYIYPFGLTFSEVDPDSLIRVGFDGQIIEGKEYQYNKTGYIIHGSIYEARSDINSIFHIHTPEIVALSTHPEGLMQLSQWALHFYGKISYHDYDSLALSGEQGKKLVSDLGKNFNIILRFHGSISAGKTIMEAMFYTYHLQMAAKSQCYSASFPKNLLLKKEICQKAVEDLLSFEKDLGKRDWLAWVRKFNL